MPRSATPVYSPDETTVRILKAIANGATPTNAAAASNVSCSTMRRKMAEIRGEWGVATNVQVIVIAIRRGLI